MSDDKLTESLQTYGNKYLIVLAASKRSRQLLSRAEKHGMSADTEKVILQSLEEVVSGKLTFDVGVPPPTPKRKYRD